MPVAKVLGVLLCTVACTASAWLAQLLPTDDACPLRDFPARLAEVDSVCCTIPGSCDGNSVLSCSPRCGGKFLRLYQDCNATMDQMLDLIDGSADGRAAQIHDLRTMCLSISGVDAIGELARMHDDPNCTVRIDAVAETVVPEASECEDTGDARLCGLVNAGILSCEADFCPSCGSNAGKCDNTCGLCGHSNDNSGKSGHRRSQGISLHSGCGMVNLAEKVAPVNTACCDIGREAICQGGGTGVPTVCDAQCAIAYLPFWTDCERALRMQFGQDTISAFQRLEQTCQSLPVVPLLKAMSDAHCASDDFGSHHGSAGSTANVGFAAWLTAHSDCSLGMLQTSFSRVDDACCEDPASCADQKDLAIHPPSTCTPQCGAAVVSLFQNCNATLQTVVPPQMHSIDEVKETCLGTTTSDIINAIRTKADAGCEIVTDGVGETEVHTAQIECEDTGPARLCSLVGAGVLACDRDFCPSPSCGHANECDRTCGYCSEQGKGRRTQLVIGDVGCNPTELQSKTDEVNVACCDPGSDLCADGVPTSCDLRCALVYIEYYQSCGAFLAALFGPVQVEQYVSLPASNGLAMLSFTKRQHQSRLARLNQVCTNLNQLDLLTALAAADCDTGCNPQGIPTCQNGGTCTSMEILGTTTLNCQCTTGWSGDTCTVQVSPGTSTGSNSGSTTPTTPADSCATMPCQNGGTCADVFGQPSCTCAAGYGGDTCTEHDAVNDCDQGVNPCQHNGICLDSFFGFSCQCVPEPSQQPGAPPVQWGGPTCSTSSAGQDNCASNPCMNGGVCQNLFVGADWTYKCTCPSMVFGTRCETRDPVNDCTNFPCCSAGGNCADMFQSAVCECNPGYTGPECNTRVSDGLQLTSGECAAGVDPTHSQTGGGSTATARLGCTHTGASTCRQGRIEVYNSAGAEWGTVCGRWMWDNDNVANIVCRQLGFEYGTLYTFGVSSQLPQLPVVWGFRSCTGTERSILDCPQPDSAHPSDPTCNLQNACTGGVDSTCTHAIDQGAVCFHGTEPSQLMPSITPCQGCQYGCASGGLSHEHMSDNHNDQPIIFGCIDFYTAHCDYDATSGGGSYDAAMAEFAACAETVPEPQGYCHGALTTAGALRNQDVCLYGASENIAFHIRIPFHVYPSGVGQYIFRMHADYGLGSFIGVDGAEHTPGNTWGHLQSDPVMLTAIDHEFEALGFEDCCDGHAELEVHLPCDRDPSAPWRIVLAGDTDCLMCSPLELPSSCSATTESAAVCNGAAAGGQNCLFGNCAFGGSSNCVPPPPPTGGR